LGEAGAAGILGVHEQAGAPYVQRRGARALHGVGQEQPPKALTLELGADCEAAEPGYRDEAGIAFRRVARHFGECDVGSCERVVTENSCRRGAEQAASCVPMGRRGICGNRHEAARNAFSLMLQRGLA